MVAMNSYEDAIVDSSRKIMDCEESIKNLKGQYKEGFAHYSKTSTDKEAKILMDIVLEIEAIKDDIKQYKSDIRVNLDELGKVKVVK